MTPQKYRLDMDVMFAVHDALRRDLVQVARIAKANDGSPGKHLHAARGWEIFKTFLVVHHTSEDASVWPALRAHADGQPDQLALADALEAEHAAVDPLMAAVDAAAADADHGYQQLGDRVDALITAVTTHLTHEEGDGLDLMDALLTEEDMAAFAQVHRQKVGENRILYVPWLMEEASERTVRHINEQFPPPIIAAYRSQWGPDWDAMNRWDGQ